MKTKKIVLLPPEELVEALASEYAKDLCIGGIVNQDAGLISLYRGDLSLVVVSLSSLRSDGPGTRPDFENFSVTDFGRTLRFGDYEVAFDALF